MLRPSVATVKRLFAVSGNRCAFPGCTIPLVDEASGKVTGRVCHIRAAKVEGPRYDPSQKEVERYDFANLVLLCPIHHDVVDADLNAYSVDRLLQMKATHESGHLSSAPLPTQAARALIQNSSIVKRGSVLFSQYQSGGQVAHSIINFASSHTAGHKNVPNPRVTEKEEEALAELWRLTSRVAKHAFMSGHNIRDAEDMTAERLRDLVTNSELSKIEKEDLLFAYTFDVVKTFRQFQYLQQRAKVIAAATEAHDYWLACKPLVSQAVARALEGALAAAVSLSAVVEFMSHITDKTQMDMSSEQERTELTKKLAELEKQIARRLRPEGA